MNQGVIRVSDSVICRLGEGDTGIKTVLEPKAAQFTGLTTGQFFSTYLHSLRLKIEIPSKLEAAIPNLEPDMSRAERVIQIRDLEWRSQRVELAMHFKREGEDWMELFRLSCLNRPPYYTINLMSYLTDGADFLLGEDCYLGASVIEVGLGGAENS